VLSSILISQQNLKQKFVDRNDELEFLNSHYKTKNPEFIIIYGRRRVGKITLISRFLQNHPGFYFMASEEGRTANIRDFADVAGNYLNDQEFKRITFPGWETLFNLWR